MANIDKELSQIKNAIYGREVRESIHDGIKKINTESEGSRTIANNNKQRQDTIEQQFADLQKEYSEANPSTAELVAARTNTDTSENYSTIGRRMDEEYKRVTSQLAETEQKKADKTEVNQLADNKADKGALAQIAQSKRDKNTEIEMEDLSQSVKESMTGGSVAVVGEDAVGNINLKDSAVENRNLHKNHAINYPYLSDDTFDLDYIWEQGNYMVSNTVANNPFGAGCTLKVDRFKTRETLASVWITQEVTIYGTSGVRGEAKKRILYVDENTMNIIWKSEWKKSSLDIVTTNDLEENIFIKYPYLGDDSFDLNDVWETGNYVVAEDVKNNHLGVSCTLKVDRFKTRETLESTWITQTLTAIGLAERGTVASRIIYVNEGSNEITYAGDWHILTSEFTSKNEYSDIVNMNWAQLEKNFNVILGKIVRFENNEIIYTDSSIFDCTEPIPVTEGEIWRIKSWRSMNSEWNEGLRGLLLDKNDNFVDYIPIDGDNEYSGISTFKIPRGVTSMVVNGRFNTSNQSQTHILKLHDWKNVWDKDAIGFTKDSIIDNNGNIVASSLKQAVTGDIPVKPGEIYRIADVHNGTGIDFTTRGVFLDNSNTVIKPIPHPNGTLPYPWNDVIVPPGATKMRVNFYYEMLTKTDAENTISINEAMPTNPIFGDDFSHLKNKKWSAYGDSVTYYADWIRLVENATGLNVRIHGHSGASMPDYRPGDNNFLARDDRIEALMADDPDVVTILTGGNAGNSELGSIDDLRVAMGDEDTTKFYGAFAYTIKKILTIKPSVKIMILESKYKNYNNNDDAPNSHGLTSLDFAKASGDVAQYFGLPFIRTRKTGANFYTSDLMLRDNIHLSMRGAEGVAEIVLSEFKNMRLLSN